MPKLHDFHASALAARQLQLDRARTTRFPKLLAHKIQRMSASPLAFLRGAAPLFYELLAERPDLAAGPAGTGWIIGDLHLENFGAYRPEPLGLSRGEPSDATFNLNDFDDAIIGPWRLDVLRLTTSVMLASRELGATGPLALDLCECLLDAWSRAVMSPKSAARALPKPVAKLVQQASRRSRTALLDARTQVVKGRRRFVRGPRYGELPREVERAVPDAFASYVANLPESERPRKGSLEILDCALRVAGTGSLGALRIAVLVEGKGGDDGGWIFDMKAQDDPSATALVAAPKLRPAERVLRAMTACLEHPPRMAGTTTLLDSSMLVRRLAPQEDKLDLAHLAGADLPDLALYLGALLGLAHARGATRPPSKPWSAAEKAALIDHATDLAGIHEGAYLAYCKLTRQLA